MRMQIASGMGFVNGSRIALRWLDAWRCQPAGLQILIGAAEAPRQFPTPADDRDRPDAPKTLIYLTHLRGAKAGSATFATSRKRIEP